MVKIERPQATVPTPYELEAIRLVLAVVGEGSQPRAAHATYERLPTGGIYSSEDLLRGEVMLLDSGLLVSSEEWIEPSERGLHLASLSGLDFIEGAVLGLLLARPPLWLSSAVDDSGVQPNYLPDDVADRFDGLGLDPDTRDEILLAAARRFDAAVSSAVGLAGEMCVVENCRRLLEEAGRAELVTSVWHASVVTDQLGYDVRSPAIDGSKCRLEVKTCSTVANTFTVLVSRNEADYGLRDPTWSLVVCRYVGGAAEVVGWCSAAMIAPQLPCDGGSPGRWRSAEIRLQLEDLVLGLPLDGRPR